MQQKKGYKLLKFSSFVQIFVVYNSIQCCCCCMHSNIYRCFSLTLERFSSSFFLCSPFFLFFLQLDCSNFSLIVNYIFFDSLYRLYLYLSMLYECWMRIIINVSVDVFNNKNNEEKKLNARKYTPYIMDFFVSLFHVFHQNDDKL